MSKYQYLHAINQVHYVHAVLGQHLVRLGVINELALPVARKAVREALDLGDQDGDQGDEFDKMDEVVQYAMTCSMVFCAACWPMHMWQGFGCGVTGDMTFGHVGGGDCISNELDKAIAALKSRPRSWELMSKPPPIQISRTDPNTDLFPEEARKAATKAMRDFMGELERHGFPQPIYSDAPRIVKWHIPFATWEGSTMYQDCGHDPELLCSYQLDPGRFLYDWVVGGRAELSPGEGVLLVNPHVGYLAQWLQGLDGMPSFRVFTDAELDQNRIHQVGRNLKGSTKKFIEWTDEPDYDPFIMVGLPPPQPVNTTSFLAPPAVAPRAITPSPQPAVQSPYCFPPPPSGPPPQQSTSSYGTSPPGSYYTAPPPPYYYSPSPASPTTSYNASPPTQCYQTSPVPEKSALDIMMQSQPQPQHHRPVPLPPLPPRQTTKFATAAYAFSPATDAELGFEAGERLEILDDSDAEGWWTARAGPGRGSRTGLVPSTFFQR
ncbi:hypothetical protein B0H63DRAFT_464886 [Podospora didyma]|uniref:SH3 domain-containing protein n=1 Tax=Podospora didyma TaxID=330526 RepID=A0AAE0U4C8_9PEZI|nr:hypothetical protein B0H63DRAFT_464886 [Podospora didyma]